MKFEYDIQKSRINKLKHGVSLEDAKLLWFGPAVDIAARTQGESRFMKVGKINDKFYSCIYTTRLFNRIIRLISARRSRKSEEVVYHEHIKT